MPFAREDLDSNCEEVRWTRKEAISNGDILWLTFQGRTACWRGGEAVASSIKGQHHRHKEDARWGEEKLLRLLDGDSRSKLASRTEWKGVEGGAGIVSFAGRTPGLSN